MAAAKSKPAKGKRAPGKKVLGRMPVKTTINLVLVDEDKISPLKAIPAILLIIVLAALFSKYLVADRLVAMSRASAQASRMRATLDAAIETVASYGDVEDTYAHYTTAGMTADELGLVDRIQVLELFGTVLPEGDGKYTLKEIEDTLAAFFDNVRAAQAASSNWADFSQRVQNLAVTPPAPTSAKSWNVSGNVLTVEVTGSSLDKLNRLARKLEQEPIVDSCTISTANKDGRADSANSVWARFIIYLVQPPEEVAEQ